MKKLIVALILAIVLGAGGYWYYTAGQADDAGTTLTLYGNVDIRDVALGFRVSGRLETMRFEEGDRIEAGTVLASLDKTPLQDELTLRQAELAEAEAALRNAEKTFARQAELVRRNTVSQSAYDDALAARDTAQARVQTATARLHLAETDLADAEIHAPEAGVILTRVREPGSIVAAGEPVYTLAIDDPVWIRTYVDEPDLGHVSPGQEATVSTDSGDTYEGQIGFISPQAEFTPKNVETVELRTDLVYRLRVIVANPDKGLRQGMPVTVTLDKRSAADAAPAGDG
jgi:HlyD family secretion protein